MAHHIKAKDIPPKKRASHVAKWRKSLRQALLNPALSDAQRAAVKRRLEEVVSGKDYGYDGRVELPGAIPRDAIPWGTGTTKKK